VKRFLIPLLAAISFPNIAIAGIPIERDIWMNIGLKPGI